MELERTVNEYEPVCGYHRSALVDHMSILEDQLEIAANWTRERFQTLEALRVCNSWGIVKDYSTVQVVKSVVETTVASSSGSRDRDLPARLANI